MMVRMIRGPVQLVRAGLGDGAGVGSAWIGWLWGGVAPRQGMGVAWSTGAAAEAITGAGPGGGGGGGARGVAGVGRGGAVAPIIEAPGIGRGRPSGVGRGVA